MRFSALLLAALLAGSVTPSWACKGPKLLFSDDFTTADPAWAPVYPDQLKVDGGRIAIGSNSGVFNSVFYEGDFFPAADICLDVTFPTASSRETLASGGGILFAGTSYDDFYAFIVRPNGSAQVYRHTKAGWLNPVPSRKPEGLSTTPNAVNTLRVKVTKSTASAFVNDKLFATFKIVSGDNAKMGIYVEAEGSTWQFANLRVSD